MTVFHFILPPSGGGTPCRRSASHIASRQALEPLLAGFYEVFERFYTADQMCTGQNTGLGLAIVKAMAQRMGHAAFAELENGTFTVGVRWTGLLPTGSKLDSPAQVH
ncbi:MAG: sensor histidine kinase [Oscillospiraceae bacterium]|nr:sensor histidine kinase [Oscillospiraceae bacterium]